MSAPSHSPAVDEVLLRRAKARLLRMHYEAGTGHIGGNLSALDILLTVFHVVLTSDDAFVLSKGHAAGALYVTLWTCGLLTDEELSTFHADDTLLSGHPPAAGLTHVPFATGSLGHGLGLANGLALARKLRAEAGRVHCLTSDGEWNEGSNWESLIFAAHHGLPVTIIVDENGLQGFGTTKEVADLDPLVDKFRAFRVPAVEVDGHDLEALACALSGHDSGPVAVIARTRKGCGVPFMENRLEWHYLPLDAEQYATALSALDVRGA